MSSEQAMYVPKAIGIRKVDRISPTFYEAALKCKARAAWIVGGEKGFVPPHPRALLGIGFHSLLEKARLFGLEGDSEDERRAVAERFFDHKIYELFSATHPLLRAKFEAPERLPFYNLFRARATQMAIAGQLASQKPSSHSNKGHVIATKSTVESTLVSRDGRISGRADVLDVATGTVIDYKTSTPDETGAVTDSELRQLRLYAFLAIENNTEIRSGRIERANHTRVEVPITIEDANEEAQNAIRVLDDYNQHVGKPFDSVASPSTSSCRFCPCIPFCEPFWKSSDVTWSSSCGTQIEGVVKSVEGGDLVSIYLDLTRGTGREGPGVVTRLSRNWLTFTGARPPEPGETVRITNGGFAEEAGELMSFRADRIATAVWIVED